MTAGRVITFCLAEDFAPDLHGQALARYPEFTKTKGATVIAREER